MPRPVLKRTETTGGAYNHPAGGFVCVITNATENQAEEYLEISYDIAEGEHAGHYEYSNSFRRYYSEPKDPSWGNALAKFLTAVEDSNPGFSIERWQQTWDCAALRWLKFGGVFKENLYTDTKGNDRSRPRFVYACGADRIREKDFKVPDPLDERVKLGGSGRSVGGFTPNDLKFQPVDDVPFY